jgi:hypothetical protein
MIKRPTPNPFCMTSEFHGCMSEEDRNLTEAKLLEWSRQERMPPYMKIGGQRSKAYWRKTDIYQWFKLRYGVVRPDCLQALIALNDGFEPAPPLVTAPLNRQQQRKRKAKAKS